MFPSWKVKENIKYQDKKRTEKRKKIRITRYHHSATGSQQTNAATGLYNDQQMRRHDKTMLMRAATTLWDCHPHPASMNTATLLCGRVKRAEGSSN